jgi:hypothetical protein
MSYQIFNDKTSQVNSMRANVMLARAVREQTEMTLDYWSKQACPTLKTTKSNYGVKAAMRIDRLYFDVYSPPPDPSDSTLVPEDQQKFYFDGDPKTQPAVCLDQGKTFDDWDKEVPDFEATGTKNFVSMTYPVIVNVDVIDSDGNLHQQQLMAQLMVVTWT